MSAITANVLTTPAGNATPAPSSATITDPHGTAVVHILQKSNHPQVRLANGKSVAWGSALLAAWLTAGAGLANAADRYVDRASVAARDSGYGPASAPYKTLAYAMSQIQPGDRLYIKEGVYRESARFPNRTWGTAATVIEGVGKVVIKANDVLTGWTSLGNNKYVKSLPKETAQVMINGTMLKQIGGRLFNAAATTFMWPARVAGDHNTMPLDSFYYDAATAQLYVRTSLASLTGQTVEVSTRMFSLFGEGLNNVTVKNLSFQYGNMSPFNRSGQVTLIGKNITVDRVTVTNADAVGLELMGDDNKILDSVANYNGQVGIKARGQRYQILRNTTNFNNTRGFNKWWEAGGVKFTGAGGLQNSLVSHHTAIGNKGDGIWFDWANLNNRLENSVSADNTGFGIQYEASQKGVITNNYVVNNGQRGIYLPHSSDSVVAFNLVAGNKLQGIVVIDENVRDPKGLINLKPVGNKVFGNLDAFNNGALVLPADLSTNKSDSNLFVGAVTVMTMRLGWSGMATDLTRWQTTTAQDKASRFNSLSFTGTGSAAYITWGKTYRTTVPKLTVSADLLALVPGGTRDLYAGPMPR